MTELDTKQRILAAAEAEFMARGYDRSRMQAIADQAGVNKAMLHYHFGSKDELFAEIFRDKSRLLFPRAEASLRAQPDFIASTCAFVDVYVSHLIANPFLPSYLIQISTNHPELLEQVPRELPKMFVQGFDAAARSGAIRSLDPLQFFVSVMGMCVMPFVGRNLIAHVLELDDAAFSALLAARADEIKASVVRMLTPEPSPQEVR